MKTRFTCLTLLTFRLLPSSKAGAGVVYLTQNRTNESCSHPDGHYLPQDKKAIDQHYIRRPFQTSLYWRRTLAGCQASAEYFRHLFSYPAAFISSLSTIRERLIDGPVVRNWNTLYRNRAQGYNAVGIKFCRFHYPALPYVRVVRLLQTCNTQQHWITQPEKRKSGPRL